MTRIKKATSKAGPSPLMIGQPTRPGQIEGGNEEPVIVGGETEVKPLNIVKSSDITKAIIYRPETNEALFIMDEHSCYSCVEPLTTPPAGTDMRYIATQSKLLYYNGNIVVDVGNIQDSAGYNHYKINNGAWRPSFQPAPNLDRWEIERMGTEGTEYGDVCLLVGEHKNNGYNTAIMLFRPALIGSTRDFTLPSSPFIPITTSTLDFSDVELFGVCWKKTMWPAESITRRLNISPGAGVDAATVGHWAFAVGTIRDGTTFHPKAYKIFYTSNENGYYAYVYDLGIENVITTGMLFGCDYDDENDVLYVAGSGYGSGNNIIAAWDMRKDSWSDLSSKLLDYSTMPAAGTAGYVVEDHTAIRLVDPAADFISDNVKRGQAIAIDLSNWHGTGNWDSECSGIFFIEKVSKTELVLDKRMPNQYYGPVPANYASPFTLWGFLQANVTATVTTVVVDVNQDMSGDNDPVNGISFPAAGGYIYIDGEIIQYTASAWADVLDPMSGFTYRRYTLTGCARGVLNTTPAPHQANFSLVPPLNANSRFVRNVVTYMEATNYLVFTRLTDCKMSPTGASVFVTGDGGLLTRYDTPLGTFTDYAEKIAIPLSLDFGKQSWKPDADSALICGNGAVESYVYQLERGYLKRISVPTTGVINDVSWSADGMSALIGGKNLCKMNKKINVEVTEREPKALPKRYLFNRASFDALSPVRLLSTIQSDALSIDDMDCDTTELFVEIQEAMTAAADGEPPVNFIDYEMRIYLAGRGDEVSTIRRNFWKGISLNDTIYLNNPHHYDSDPNVHDDVSNARQWRKSWKLPTWAKYIAVDLVSKNRYTLVAPFITVGIQGGVR